jgi:hypothetical protein
MRPTRAMSISTQSSAPNAASPSTSSRGALSNTRFPDSANCPSPSFSSEAGCVMVSGRALRRLAAGLRLEPLDDRRQPPLVDLGPDVVRKLRT